MTLAEAPVDTVDEMEKKKKSVHACRMRLSFFLELRSSLSRPVALRTNHQQAIAQHNQKKIRTYFFSLERLHRDRLRSCPRILVGWHLQQKK